MGSGRLSHVDTPLSAFPPKPPIPFQPPPALPLTPIPSLHQSGHRPAQTQLALSRTRSLAPPANPNPADRRTSPPAPKIESPGGNPRPRPSRHIRPPGVACLLKPGRRLAVAPEPAAAGARTRPRHRPEPSPQPRQAPGAAAIRRLGTVRNVLFCSRLCSSPRELFLPALAFICRSGIFSPPQSREAKSAVGG
jgi:hypothetical protein